MWTGPQSYILAANLRLASEIGLVLPWEGFFTKKNVGGEGQGILECNLKSTVLVVYVLKTKQVFLIHGIV